MEKIDFKYTRPTPSYVNTVPMICMSASLVVDYFTKSTNANIGITMYYVAFALIALALMIQFLNRMAKGLFIFEEHGVKIKRGGNEQFLEYGDIDKILKCYGPVKRSFLKKQSDVFNKYVIHSKSGGSVSIMFHSALMNESDKAKSSSPLGIAVTKISQISGIQMTNEYPDESSHKFDSYLSK